MLKQFFTILFIALIGTTLINGGFFVYQTQSAFYGFLIIATFLIICTGVLLIKNKNLNSFTWPVLFPLILAIYFLIHPIILGHIFNFRIQYLIVCCLLCSTVQILLLRGYLNLRLLFNSLNIFLLFECIICILQYFSALPSLNTFFDVTGSLINPNVAAMFIVMVYPFTLILFLNHRKHPYLKFVYGLFLCLVFVTLLMLKCRTAAIGIALITLYVLQEQFYLWQNFKQKFAISKKILTGLLVIVVIAALSGYTYNAKKESADSRKLVWKISAAMFLEKPLLGYGYGEFERNYNIAQAEYFKNGNGTPDEKANAGAIKMAYNEYLESAVEGGIIGLLIFASLLYILLVKPLLGKTNAEKDIINNSSANPPIVITQTTSVAYAGVLAFAAMSFVNFTITAVPVFAIVTFYAAILLNATYTLPAKKHRILQVVKYFLLVSGSLLLYKISKDALNYRALKLAINFEKNGNNDKALQLLQRLPYSMQTSPTYCETVGRIYFYKKEYVTALAKFEQANAITPTPDLCMNIGSCQQALMQYNNAINAYQGALYLKPNRFAPLYALLIVYLLQKDTTHANQMATIIINQKPKVESEVVNEYKKFADSVLKSTRKKEY